MTLYVCTLTIYVSISSILGIYLQLQHNMGSGSPHPQLSDLRNVLKTLQSAVSAVTQQSICLLELVLEDSLEFL